jgi:hypothetical protein
MADERIVVDHPLVHPSGVFFGLPEEQYHAALALSATGIKALRVDPMQWWSQSPLNPDRKDEETLAMKIGKAFHARIVEGPEVFQRRYAAILDPAEYPDALRTVSDLTEALARHLLKPRPKSLKADIVQQLLAVEPTAQIWDEMIRIHAEKHEGKIMLEADLVEQIERAARRIEGHPDLGRAFADGYPEVSVFWVDEDTGVPCKSRFDYLKPRAIVDLKTFALRDVLPDKAIVQAVARYGYFIQTAFYLRAAAQLPQLVAEGRVAGDHDPQFLREVVENEKRFLFIWQAAGAPLVKGKVLGPGIVLDMGHALVEEALLHWAEAWRRWGTAEWNVVHPITSFDDAEFPSWIW